MEMHEVMAYINQANETEINLILDEVLDRYKALYPNWEINIFSLPARSGQERREAFNRIVNFARKYGNV